jgi:hypothetical protein
MSRGTCTPRGAWRRDEIAGEGRVPVPVPGTRLALDAVYEGVDLPPLVVREGEDWEEWQDYVDETVEAPTQREGSETPTVAHRVPGVRGCVPPGSFEDDC